jgi:hypothetical protein
MSTQRLGLLLPVLLVLFLVGCSDSPTASLDETDSVASFDVETLSEVESEEEAVFQFPPSTEMEILIGGLDGLNKSQNTALVQVVHNAPDIRAFFVDVYVNGQLAINNFRFRKATPFLELPVGLEVAIAPFYSRSVRDAIATFNYDLAAGEKYVVVANGVLKQRRYYQNPEGLDVAFNLYPYAPAREVAEDAQSVELLVFHGSPDAPTVDVQARGVGTLIDDIAYGDFRGYLPVPPAAYTLDVTTADGSAVAASFGADVSGLAGGAATVLASGFLTPPGFRFQLIVVLADGTVITLPKTRQSNRSRWRHWWR